MLNGCRCSGPVDDDVFADFWVKVTDVSLLQLAAYEILLVLLILDAEGFFTLRRGRGFSPCVSFLFFSWVR